MRALRNSAASSTLNLLVGAGDHVFRRKGEERKGRKRPLMPPALAAPSLSWLHERGARKREREGGTEGNATLVITLDRLVNPFQLEIELWRGGEGGGKGKEGKGKKGLRAPYDPPYYPTTSRNCWRQERERREEGGGGKRGGRIETGTGARMASLVRAL